MSSVDTLLQGFNGKEEFREGLVEMQQQLRTERKYLQAARVGRILRRRARFDKVYEQAAEQAAKDLQASPRATEFGDGQFMTWFLEWLQNGGWEIILDLIMKMFL